MISLALVGLVVVLIFFALLICGIAEANEGLIFMLLVIFTLVSGIMGATVYKNSIKKECELNLPRNQHCVVTAVPVNKEL